jgi:hypothetical protein
MPNEQRGEKSITLGDAEYTLAYEFEALAEIESKARCGIIKFAFRFLPELQGGSLDYTLADIHIALSAGIKRGGAEVPADLGKRIMQAGVVNVGRKLGEILVTALQGGQSGNAEPAKE